MKIPPAEYEKRTEEERRAARHELTLAAFKATKVTNFGVIGPGLEPNEQGPDRVPQVALTADPGGKPQGSKTKGRRTKDKNAWKSRGTFARAALVDCPMSSALCPLPFVLCPLSLPFALMTFRESRIDRSQAAPPHEGPDDAQRPPPRGKGPAGRGRGHRRDYEDQPGDPRHQRPTRPTRPAPQAARVRPRNLPSSVPTCRMTSRSASSPSRGRTRPAARFSNGSQDDDEKGDIHGLAIKLMGVGGPKVLDAERDETTHTTSS